jgi:hypothetical protein
MTTDERQGTRLTREQLYELVWTEPMQVLGPRYGMSDVGLKKACTRLRIPTPGRGYWAQKAVGKAPRRTSLPKLPASVPAQQQCITFGRPPKVSLNETVVSTGPVADQERFEASAENRIVVSEMLTEPHKLVAASVQLLRQAKSDQQHRLIPRGKRCLAAAVTLGTTDRAMVIYDTLIKACEMRGWTVAVTEGDQGSATVVTVAEENIGIAIEERVDRIERKPDPHGKATHWGKEYDYISSGRLTIRLQLAYLGVRQSWSDGAKQRLEDCLNSVMVGLVAAAEALNAQRLERDARQREFQAAEERRQLAEKRRQEEAARVRALDADLGAWRKAVVIREYAAAMRKSAEAAGLLAEGTPVTNWLAWVVAYADRVDPAARLPSVPADPQPHAWPGYGYANAPSEPRPLW